MRAAVVTALDGPSGLTTRDVPEPRPTPGSVLIDVEYAGVGYPDLLQSRGLYQRRPDPPFIPGWEVAGVVRAAAGSFRAGDRVAAMSMLGGFAETVAVPEHLTFPVPSGVPLDKAAAAVLNYLTAHFALSRRARLRRGETVLVHGAAGGVGTATCQLARALGARVIAVTSTEVKASLVRAAGAHEVVPAGTFRADALRLTGGAGVDVIVDPVGGERFTDSLRSLAPEGRALVVGFTGGAIPTVKVNRLLLTNTSVFGVGSAEFWNRNPDELAKQWAELAPLLQSGELDPVIGAVFSLDDAGAALAEIEGRRALGKLVIRVRR